MLTRRRLLALPAALAALPIATLPITGRAHHGWMKWDEENPVSIEGWISKEMNGFPHWEIDVRVDGVDWEVDVGDPWALRKAGLKDDGSDFTLRRDILVEGLRPLDQNILRVLPRRIVLDGDKPYDLIVEG